MIQAVIITAILAFCLAVAARTMRPAGRAEKANYLTFVAAAYPWLIYSCFARPPLWWTITAAILAGAALLIFLIDTVRFLREGRTLLAEISAQYPDPPAAEPGPPAGGQEARP